MMMEVRTALTRGDELIIPPSSTAADLSVIVVRLEGREAREVILSCIKLKYFYTSILKYFLFFEILKYF